VGDGDGNLLTPKPASKKPRNMKVIGISKFILLIRRRVYRQQVETLCVINSCLESQCFQSFQRAKANIVLQQEQS